MTHAEEKEWIEGVKRGDEHAWTSLVNRFGGKVYGIALRFLLNEKDAEDATQEVWLSVSRKIHGFRGESSLGTWLYRIAVNKCLEKIRSRKRNRTESMDEFLPSFKDDGHYRFDVPDWTQKPASTVENKILKSEIEKVIRQIPDKYRQVLVLRDIEGLSGLETAEMLGLTEAAVKTRLHRARSFVREKFSRKFGKKPWFAFLRTFLV